MTRHERKAPQGQFMNCPHQCVARVQPGAPVARMVRVRPGCSVGVEAGPVKRTPFTASIQLSWEWLGLTLFDESVS
ncbi:hypothetical protein THTE_1902 [Thermogutta terrifontis]|uniref:Uncharacterized protein n=1 Tax=Thermogutta terrifontis TaxID=1331910 RepID=A0A286REX7_9BACT|nr:hypothetical protein THTE_1902 [Thermogutta terrifontis]